MSSLSMTERGFGYEMGSVIRTNLKTFFCLTYERVMKFMPLNELEFVLCIEKMLYTVTR